MIFVDTGAWFASLIATDINHAAATAWLSQNQQPLATTDYIVDETLTLFKARGELAHGLALGGQFFLGQLAFVHYLSPADVEAVWQVFHQVKDKEWSFTDCTSKIVMENLKITHAFTFDHHFRQFGSVQVVP